MIEKCCLLCGADINPTNERARWQKYCGPECAKKAANMREVASRNANKVERKEVAERAMGLDKCMKEADRLGISYGKYMASRKDGR